MLVKVIEHLLKSGAMRSDVDGSYVELEKELLEYLAMIDPQNRKATGNFDSVADSAAHNDQEGPIYDYTQPWWDDSCAVIEANPQQKEKSTLPNKITTQHNFIVSELFTIIT